MKPYLSVRAAKMAVLILVLIPVELFGQSASVDHVNASTVDGLHFSASAIPPAVRYGQNIVVHFKVTNRGTKTIFLVHDNTSNLIVERRSITLPMPLVLLGGHESYDYSFIKVAPSKTYSGKVVIPQDKYQQAQLWIVNIGFGYVTDITGLNTPLAPNDDPAPLKALLNSRLETVRLCGIGVKVTDPD